MPNRREFLAGAAGGLLAAAVGDWPALAATAEPDRARVALVKGQGREAAIGRSVDLLGVNPVRGRKVLLKPNFNTADPFPASTHNDTLRHLIGHLRTLGAGAITMGERAGPPVTAEVIKDKGIDRLCRELEVGLIDFETLPEAEWVRVRPRQSHWRDGFDFAGPVLDADCVVSTCCLKTHRYGGVFTMSLKLSVGMVHKRNMQELHGSRQQHMRRMIAEVNQAYRPALIVMDGTEVFVDGGPMHGVKRPAGVMVAGTDRIAVDAVGLAVLKELGANQAIMATPIFAQEQIARAVELGLGVCRPEDIDIVTADPQSRAYAARLTAILQREAAG